MSEHMPLIIELKLKETSVYCYFHNSASTDMATYYGEALIELYHKDGYENSPLEPEIIGYELFHKLRKICPFGVGLSMAGFCEEAYEYMCKKYPNYSFNEAVDRYVGFIFISEPQKDAFQSVQRSKSIPTDSFIIDFDKKSVSFGLFHLDDINAVATEDLPVIDYDFKNIPIDDFKKLHGLLDEKFSFAHHENGKRYIYSKLYS
ncbi:MAG: hypothetical protein R3Y35_03375 [Clostridia bacterium]